jgi:RNA polymerase sigma-70 factor (ECF subfamily)
MDRTPYSMGARPQVAATTLGDVLYAGHSSRGFPEADWVRLVESVAAGDRLALDRLYQRTDRMVFTLLVRLTSNARIAEDLMLDLYRDLPRGTPRHEAVHGTVLGWIMNETRARAIARLRSEQQKDSRDPRHASLMAIDAPNYQDLLQTKEAARQLRLALLALIPEERASIELAFFSELTLEEIGARMNLPVELAATRLRSGLHKLRHALAPRANGSLLAGALNACDQARLVCAHALGALPPAQAAGSEAHLFSCSSCRRELESLRPVVESFHLWPVDVLRPTPSAHERLALPMAVERQPEWADVAPGISCKILATDGESHMVSMLVRLAPGGEYPPHTHAGVEELHLLDGELWIEDRKLYPGDYNRAEPGTGDKRVWSETGCTCVLVTSTRDVLS